ncbi:MAG: dynamin family protein, partial [Myxococcota bacterium]
MNQSPEIQAPFEAFNQRRREVIEELASLKDHAARVGASTLATRIGREVVQKLEADRFNLVVVGEFNHGKTTFVNALLGRSILPTGVTPTTAVIHHVTHAETPTATLVQKGGAQQTHPFDQLRGLMVGGEVDIETIRHVEVGVPAPFLAERIVLVDTPGVNDLCLQRADITYKYIPQSDAVLFVMDAGQPLKESERQFIEEKLLGQSRDKIIFVVSKADIWSDDERREALGYVNEELAKLVKNPVVFPVMSQRALNGDVKQSGMPELLSHLTSFLADERGRIMIGNALGDGLTACRSLRHSIDARRRAARMSKDEIDRRIERIEADLEGQEKTVQERRAAIREEIAAIRAWVRRDLDRFCDDVIRQLPDIVEKSSGEELRVHLPSFLESTFVEWSTKEAEEVARALEDLAEKTVTLMRDSAHEAAERLGEGAKSDVAAPDIKIDTFGYDLGVAALLSVGLGMLFTNVIVGALMAGAAPVLAYYLKGRVEQQTKEKAKEQAAVALREAAAKVGPKLDEMINEFADRLDQWVESAGKEVHRELIDVLEAAKKEATEAPDIVAVDKNAAELIAELKHIRTH